MAGRGAGLLGQIHRLWDLGTFAGLTDAQLLYHKLSMQNRNPGSEWKKRVRDITKYSRSAHLDDT